MKPARGVRYVVLDFDGTFTEVEKEGEPFTRAYQESFSDLIGKDEAHVKEVWKTAERRVRQDPDRFGGFEDAGKIVAPPCDPYLRANAVSRIMCQRFQVLKDAQLRNEVLTALYRRAYRQTATCFREDAARTLDAILALPGIEVFVVTNAVPTTVKTKIAQLGSKLATEARPLVVGEAYKFGIGDKALDPSGSVSAGLRAKLPEWASRFQAVPESLEAKGVGRPIFLRRNSYFRVLRDQVWKEDLAGPEATIVVGDVYELDLALPAALGAYVHLVTREETPPHEVSIVEGLERGAVSPDLGAVLARLGG